jgi:mannan endo-1,4-beta-mannosidase
MKIIPSIILFFLCCSVLSAQNTSHSLVDGQATQETVALYDNLSSISEQGFLFGHQDTDAYGVTWQYDSGRSDVLDVCGSHAAIHGWDLGNETEATNLDSVPFNVILLGIKNAYLRGGVNTISWHVDSPVSGDDSWTKSEVVAHILPGGARHKDYVKRLDIVADFINKCQVGNVKIPIIFRPFHEHNGNWFWWGKTNCKEADYVRLWRFTVDYLRRTRHIHHLIYAFSPDRSQINFDSAETSYLYAYPGDEYVDIIGLDNYMDVGISWNTRSREQQRNDFIKILSVTSQLAKAKGKVAALTETGLEGITNPTWFTDVILNPIKSTPQIRIAYVMVWRNANRKHHYVPYKGHPAESDFVSFYQDTETYFEKDLINIYKYSKTPEQK